MSEPPKDSGLTSGDPLSPGPDGPRHESGLPAYEPSEAASGYTSPPPPGALAGVAQQHAPPLAAGQYQLAGWWSRVGAALIDSLIIGVGALAILAIFGSVFSVGFFDSEETGVVALVVGMMFAFVAIAIVALLYAPFMMDRTNGKTLGRMALGIRVVRANGRPITFGFAMLREVVVKALLFGFASSLTFGLASLLDVLWPLWDDENRALHDFVVDTRTVRD
jgi:uncharacterized RDD family membrane protein YckC